MLFINFVGVHGDGCECYLFQGGIHLYSIINSYVNRLDFTLIIFSTVPFLLGYGEYTITTTTVVKTVIIIMSGQISIMFMSD